MVMEKRAGTKRGGGRGGGGKRTCGAGLKGEGYETLTWDNLLTTFVFNLSDPWGALHHNTMALKELPHAIHEMEPLLMFSKSYPLQE